MTEGGFVHQSSAWLGLILSAVSLGIVIFNAGRWSGRMERAEKHIHDMKNSLQYYLPREIHVMSMSALERQLKDLNEEVKAGNRMSRQVLLKLVGHGIDVGDDS